jgi:hypothetical protein
MSFTVLAPTTINLSFHNEGGDNIGLILDNVNLNLVSGVPDSGSTIVFLAIGILGLGLIRRSSGAQGNTPIVTIPPRLSSSDK